MPNQLTLLPPDKTFADIQSAVATFPEVAPIVDISARLNLKEREEFIFTAPTWSGKTTLLRQHGLSSTAPFPAGPTSDIVYGVYDDSGQDDDATIIKTIVAMLRIQREDRYHTPRYKPIILLRKSTWHRIGPHFNWVPRHRVGQLSFPVEAYAGMLRTAGAPEWLIHGYLGPAWLDGLKDAHGHLLPRLAWDATLELRNQTALTTAKPQAIGASSVGYLRACPTVQPFIQHLTFVVPDDKRYTLRGRPLEMTLDRLDSRLLSALRAAPFPVANWTRKDFIDAAVAEGILRRRPQLAYIFAPPFASGLPSIKNMLALGQLVW